VESPLIGMTKRQIQLSLVAFPAFGQTPSTATEAFNLRIKCKQMADEKAEAMSWHPLSTADGATMNVPPAAVERLNRATEPFVVLSSRASRYDPKTNRCYLEIHDHTQKKGRDVDIRSVSPPY
jgi:hypothetical protein